jgi:hypothetical protein
MPDNSAYFKAAYVAIAVLHGGYIATIWWRARRLEQRLRQNRG